MSGSQGSPYVLSDHESDQASELGDVPVAIDSSSDSNSNSDESESGSEAEPESQPQPVRQTLYQRIQAVVARTRAQEERERHELEIRRQRGEEEGSPGDDNNDVDSDIDRRNNNVESKRRWLMTQRLISQLPAIPPSWERPKDFPALPTLANMAEKEVLRQLKNAVSGSQSTANYCCGGSFPILELETEEEIEDDSSSEATASPVVVRWDSAIGGNTSHRVQFPLLVERDDRSLDLSHENSKSDFDSLIDACYSTGLGQIDSSRFSTDFCPHSRGVLDIINQVLLPDLDAAQRGDSIKTRGARARLRCLTISTPEDYNSYPNIDPVTDVSSYLGTLLVCLPNAHEGGQLQVEFKGHSTFFEWDDMSSDSIQWAAFHKDCEFATNRVESGEQVILTYSLHSMEFDNVMIPSTLADTTTTPLYAGVKEVLEQGRFLEEGCTFAFYCRHQYFHTHAQANLRLPLELKGIDATIFSVFQTLGLAVSAHPVLHQKDLAAYPLDLVKADPTSEYDSEGDKVTTRGERYTFGDRFQELLLMSVSGEVSQHEAVSRLKKKWPMRRRANVIWLNEPSEQGWEVAIASMEYKAQGTATARVRDGDNFFFEGSRRTHCVRSHVAVLIELPRRKKRPVTLGPAEIW